MVGGLHIKGDTEDDKRRVVAMIATAVAALVVMLIMFFSHISYEWPPKDMPPESEILFGGEFVALGNFDVLQEQSTSASSAKSDNATPDSHDMVDSGSDDAASQVVSTEHESSVVVEKREEKQGPTKEELAAIEKARKEKETAAKINKRVSFSSNGSSAGSAGVPDGSADASEINGQASFSLKGRNAEHFARAQSGVDGKVVIEVRVDPQGKVTEARYVSGSGSAAGSQAVRRSCVQASLNSRFSVARDIANDQIGTITWTFE